ncbi:MAG: hypothetical protein ACLQIB_51870 [Isosphaeraceae bacterium]
MTARRPVAPPFDGGLLVEPGPSAAIARIAENAARLSTWDYDFQGRRADTLRQKAREEVLGLARGFLAGHGLDSPRFDLAVARPSSIPLVVTGHQPELFHPGVWVKNFITAAAAHSSGGVGLNLVVDNDIPKSSSIEVPRARGDLVETERVEFDRWGSETPYEDWVATNENQLASFPERVRLVMGDLVADPILDEFWPRVVARRGDVGTVGLRFALARHELESSWGVDNLELPLSTICESDSFLWFASHLLAQLPRYRRVHNAALLEYRAAHGIRSRNHPVAALARQGDWLEAPFWVWRVEQPRRRALFARQRGRFMELRIAGEDEILIELPLTPEGQACCAVERLRELPARSLRLRTRALLTTMYSRLLLGDLFIHGIGGSKYDELGDEIMRLFLGIEPPEFLTVSMTVWLGLPQEQTSPADIASIDRHLRDLEYNPDRHLSEPLNEEARNWIRAKRQAIGGSVDTHRQRVARWQIIRECNQVLQSFVEEQRVGWSALRSKAWERARSNRVARSREFAFVLHSAERLRRLFGETTRAQWVTAEDQRGGLSMSRLS